MTRWLSLCNVYLYLILSLWIVVYAGQFGQIINGAVTLELMLNEYEYVVPESNTPAIQYIL